jgi:hypothetical protein
MSELQINSVQHVTGHILNIQFNDGHKCLVDFSRFIFGSGHPDYEPYKSVDRFLQFDIVDGNLNWDDYTMIFPVEDLYFNRIHP